MSGPNGNGATPGYCTTSTLPSALADPDRAAAYIEAELGHKTAAEIADVVGVTDRTVRRWRRDNVVAEAVRYHGGLGKLADIEAAYDPGLADVLTGLAVIAIDVGNVAEARRCIEAAGQADRLGSRADTIEAAMTAKADRLAAQRRAMAARPIR